MQRREAVRLLGVMASVPFLPQSAEAATELAERIHREVQGGGGFRTLNATQQRLVGHIADVILPASDTPGALDGCNETCHTAAAVMARNGATGRA